MKYQARVELPTILVTFEADETLSDCIKQEIAAEAAIKKFMDGSGEPYVEDYWELGESDD